MNVRDLPTSGRTQVPVTRGTSPISAFQDEMNKLFSDFFGELSLPGWVRTAESIFAVTPALDITESEKDFSVSVEIPGIDAKDVQVTASEGYVTVKGEKKREKLEEKEGYYRQERSYGGFQRVVALPETANLEKMEANYKNGILTLFIPKKAGAQTKERKVEVKQAA